MRWMWRSQCPRPLASPLPPGHPPLHLPCKRSAPKTLDTTSKETLRFQRYSCLIFLLCVYVVFMLSNPICFHVRQALETLIFYVSMSFSHLKVLRCIMNSYEFLKNSMQYLPASTCDRGAPAVYVSNVRPGQNGMITPQ